MPMHCTAIGKALLATAEPELQHEVLAGPLERRTPRTIFAPGVLQKQLRKVLESGVAHEHEESALGLLCVAAPVFEPDGHTTIAAISVSGPTGRFRPEAHEMAVRAAATALGTTLARRRR
jgi:DNA-binding IclR family transcriptional regulator